jgi:hypothetical protein
VGAAPITRLALATAAAVAVCGAVSPARSDPPASTACTGVDDSGRFATCFDPGNRLFVTASSEGYGGGVAVRHVMHFDDEPDLTWKLEHELFRAEYAVFDERTDGVLYAGRYLRHARDGHIVLPFAVGKKIFVPFDIGAEAEVGRLRAVSGQPTFEIGVVRTAALIDLARSRSFRRRLSVGAVLHWDMDVRHEPWEIAEHRVAPFSSAVVDARAESGSGVTTGGVRLEGGRVWSSEAGWHNAAQAEVSLERIVLAINDRPLSLVLGARYRSRSDELYGRIGVRFALFQRTDRRVNLRPLASPE